LAALSTAVQAATIASFVVSEPGRVTHVVHSGLSSARLGAARITRIRNKPSQTNRISVSGFLFRASASHTPVQGERFAGFAAGPFRFTRLVLAACQLA
jgi:hypothetical protein